MANTEPLNNREPVGTEFRTTHWSLVLRAGDISCSGRSEALENLCRAYWRPLYGFVRRRGYDEHEAKDLTQGFFARLLEKNDVADADASRGKFRTYLLTLLNHFLANEWDKSRRLKRGGGVSVVSLDDADAESRYLLESSPDWSAEKVFDRRWAEAVLEAVFVRFRREVAESGDTERYEVLKPFLLGGEGSQSYADASARLGISETGVRSVVHRFRKRFRELVRAEIAHTVARPEDIDGEIAYLFSALAG
ncbi:MAG: sigma-70 family RNA polymerase sigma factor [Verrucomicrobiales bacterium]|nr:sigma-70 family RNA polymerase sigma factor [Verrucomicrobiales bacterium]